ncbi:MAG: hypothetical protein EAZ95_10700 [Bacteroidetes bacterium]|nr:MAG: hypothetical protein EAZ95_10700 [Bacteroidota bacterium]
MHPTLEIASQYLDKANVSICFEVLESIVPQESLHEFNTLRNDYIDKGTNWRDTDRLRTFIGKLKRALPAEVETADSPVVVLPTFTIEDFQKLDLAHALRPELTRLYVRKLAHERQCLNIYGESGTGKGRMLADIARAGLPHSIFVQAQIQFEK